jgi:TonB family protein
MNWLHYLMEANLYLVIFYLCYCLLLNRETYYTFNRVYLLFSCVAAFVLPMLQLGRLKPTPVATHVEYAATAAIPLAQQGVAIVAPVNVQSAFTWNDGLVYAYAIGAGIFLLVLLFKLYKLMRLAHSGKSGEQQGYQLVRLDESNTAFSFFKYLFIGTSTSADTIIRHELVHIRQKHSVDIIFIELLKVFNWFNPVIYLMQRSLRAVHEYIADEQTASTENGTLAYSSFLVENAYGMSGTSVTHSFFNYNLLKKRIIMLNQQRSGRSARLKYLVIAPLCGGMLCLSTLAFSKTYGWVDIAPRHVNNAAAKSEPSTRLWTSTHDNVVISDKFSHEFRDGSIKFYTVNTITVEDVHSLAKDDGTVVKLITDGVIDSVTRTSKLSGSSEKYHTTSKGYRYEQMVYFTNGKGDYRVLIWDNKNQKEYWKSKTSAAEVKMLKDKYGYTFPDMPIYSKLPPPPPMAPPAPGHKAPIPSSAPADGKYQSAPPAATMDHKAPPPPPQPPAQPAKMQAVLLTPPVAGQNESQLFIPLNQQLAKYVLYPAQDRDQKIQGRVFLRFEITADKKIDNVEAMRGPDDNLSNEAVRVLKKCDVPEQAKPGVYVIPVDFVIMDSNNNYVDGPKLVKDYKFAAVPDKATSLSEVVVTSYLR